eukprot:5336272-Pleurochrysis_carterae.AAC.1
MRRGRTSSYHYIDWAMHRRKDSPSSEGRVSPRKGRALRREKGRALRDERGRAPIGGRGPKAGGRAAPIAEERTMGLLDTMGRICITHC